MHRHLIPPPERKGIRGAVSTSDHVLYSGERIQFHKVPDSLNSRFLPVKGMTTDAVFAVDDDIRVPCSDLQLAFEVWGNSQHTIVGFYPRLHLKSSSQPAQYEYHSWWYVWWTGQYSMILTKAALLHRNYLTLYSNDLPKSVLKYVDDHMNCEDLAMQFLISNVSGLPPIYVRSDVYDVGVLGGISTRSGHMGARSDCLNDMIKLFGYHHDSNSMSQQLPMSSVVVGRASSFALNRPATWMEYLASDLPISIPFQVILLLVVLFFLFKVALYLWRCLIAHLKREKVCSDGTTDRWKQLKS
jgi:hypothetical protein